MSFTDEALKLAVDLAASAAHAALEKTLAPEHKAQALDATAERLRFDADGQRKLDAHRKAGG